MNLEIIVNVEDDVGKISGDQEAISRNAWDVLEAVRQRNAEDMHPKTNEQTYGLTVKVKDDVGKISGDQEAIYENARGVFEAVRQRNVEDKYSE